MEGSHCGGTAWKNRSEALGSVKGGLVVDLPTKHLRKALTVLRATRFWQQTETYTDGWFVCTILGLDSFVFPSLNHSTTLTRLNVGVLLRFEQFCFPCFSLLYL